MSCASLVIRKVKLIASSAVFALVTGSSFAEGTKMTAGTIMEEMNPADRFLFVSGMVEGFAYARFRSDSTKAGSKDEAGMACVLDAFYKDMKASMDRIEAAFVKYPEYYPSTLVAAIIKKECGE